MTTDAHTELVGRTEDTLRYLIDSGQTEAPQYGLLAQARSGLLSEPVGSPRYEAQARTAEAQMNQVAEMRDQQMSVNPYSDPDFANAACDCVAGEPCCMTAVTIGCSHGSTRLSLPLTSDDQEPVLAIVCDKPGTTPKDTISVTIERTPEPSCGMQGQRPRMHLNGRNENRFFDTDSFTHDMVFHSAYRDDSTSLAKFASAMYTALYEDLDDLGQSYRLRLLNCTQVTEFDSRLRVFPKVGWSTSNFGFRITGTFASDLSFTPQITFRGSLTGTYGASEFSIQAEGESSAEAARQEDTRSVIPFINSAMDRLRSQTATDQGPSQHGSHIQFRHELDLGNSNFDLAEHSTDISKVGISGRINLGYAPFFGITIRLDLVEALIRGASGVAPGLANTLLEAREAAATGIGTSETAVRARFDATVNLDATGDVGGSVTLTRAAGADNWEGSGSVYGEIGLSLAARIRGRARAYFVSGAFSAEGTASSKIKASLATLTASQRGTTDNKLRTKVEWDGLKITYRAQARAGIGFASVSGSTGGTIIICDKATLYDETT